MADVEDVVSDILEHHGVKGMHWGVRRAKQARQDNGHQGKSVSARKIKKLDKKFENQNAAHVFISIHNRAAEMSNNHDIDRINNKPQYKNMDFSKDSPLRRQYMNEHQQAFLNNVRKAAAEHGTNASGTRHITINSDKHGNWEPVLTDTKVKHSDFAPITAGNQSQTDFAPLTDPMTALHKKKINVDYDESGRVLSINLPQGNMSHTEEVVENILAHYGVKGMHWGSRKGSSGGSSGGIKARVGAARDHVKKDISERQAHEVTVRAKPGSMVRVVGGNKHMPHEDAIKARVAEQIAKKNSLDSLSNPQLQHLVNRMNLESQYRNLASNETRASAGEKAAKEFMGSKHANVAFAKLGPHAALGKKVADGVFKQATRNKAMEGGTVKKKGDKEKDKKD